MKDVSSGRIWSHLALVFHIAVFQQCASWELSSWSQLQTGQLLSMAAVLRGAAGFSPRVPGLGCVSRGASPLGLQPFSPWAQTYAPGTGQEDQRLGQTSGFHPIPGT